MGKATLYFQGGYGICKLEVKEVTTTRGKYAQYPSAVFCTFKQPRQRRERSFVQTFQPSLLVLDGWGHPNPDDPFLAPKETGTPGITSREGRYSSCDPRWRADFDALIDGYIARVGAKVLADYRKANPNDPLPEGAQS